MNIVSNFYPKCNSIAKNSARNHSNSPSFGRIIDYYDPEEIKEAGEHNGVFRAPGEDDFSYEKRAREINEAWDRQDRLREKSNEKSWWKFW